jgi:SPX domain protein involved in polyphosphate accumulation
MAKSTAHKTKAADPIPHRSKRDERRSTARTPDGEIATLARDVLELFVGCQRLQSYRSLNLTAFRKVAKKLDKKVFVNGSIPSQEIFWYNQFCEA